MTGKSELDLPVTLPGVRLPFDVPIMCACNCFVCECGYLYETYVSLWGSVGCHC